MAIAHNGQVYVTAAEFAARCGVTQSCVGAWIRRGKIPASRTAAIGRTVLILDDTPRPQPRPPGRKPAKSR